MSTLSYTVAAPALGRSVAVTPAPLQTRLRLTVRGRRVLAFLVALPIIVALAAGAVSGGAALASHEQGAAAGSFETVTVMPGDTLWSIAVEAAPGVDPRDAVAEIAGLNNLSTSQLTAGQSLALPAGYSAN